MKENRIEKISVTLTDGAVVEIPVSDALITTDVETIDHISCMGGLRTKHDRVVCAQTITITARLRGEMETTYTAANASIDFLLDKILLEQSRAKNGILERSMVDSARVEFVQSQLRKHICSGSRKDPRNGGGVSQGPAPRSETEAYDKLWSLIRRGY